MNLKDSIDEQFADPIPIEYVSPLPYCVCPDMEREENVVKVAEECYKILKADI